MFVRAYLRASTKEQDALRARQPLVDFAQQYGQRIAGFYVENESGASLQRPELFRLLADSECGDVLLVEQVDRLARLNAEDWQLLRNMIASKGVVVVALDLPTSHQAMSMGVADPFTSRMLVAVNAMLMDMLAAVARKDYEDRRRRQAQGIDKAKAGGIYTGRKIDTALHARIAEVLAVGKSVRKTAELVGCSTQTVQRVKAILEPG